MNHFYSSDDFKIIRVKDKKNPFKQVLQGIYNIFSMINEVNSQFQFSKQASV